MFAHRIRRGLTVRLDGAPVGELVDAAPVRHVAIRPGDVAGLKPSLLVEVGQQVRLGEPLVRDRLRPEVMLPSPAAGVVRAIHRGERRALRSVVVEIDPHLEASADGVLAFSAVPLEAIQRLSRSDLIARLCAAGLLARLRTRPFGRVPEMDVVPQAIFVTAIATDPHALPPELAVAADPAAFEAGLAALTRLTDGPVFLCRGPRASMPEGDPARVRVVTFEGPHPAGLAGTHIARLHPVFHQGLVVTAGAQETMDLGAFLLRGRLRTERLVSLCGFHALRPRFVRTRCGASLRELVGTDALAADSRMVSGSPLVGEVVTEPTAFLGTFDQQVTLCAPSVPTQREARPVVLPLPLYDRVVPLPVPVVPLLRALLAGDVEEADLYGVRGLVEEDLALCTHVCPSRHDYGGALRRVLDALAEGK